MPVLIGLLLLVQGCAGIKDKLFGSEHEEITPFAQKTVEVLAIENMQIRESELVHLRPYVDERFVVLGELQKEMRRVDEVRDAVIAYSLDLVRVIELFHSDEERVDAYAGYIEQSVTELALLKPDISGQEWEQIIADIRSQESLLDALRAFQPVINRASRDFEQLISRIEDELVVDARAEFDRRIEADFSSINDFLSRQHTKREQLVLAMNAIDQYLQGDKQAIARFRQRPTALGSLFASDTPSAQQVDRLEADLHERLKRTTSMITEMSADSARYLKVRDELDRQEAKLRASLNIARVQITTWTLSHQALASGVKDPGEWMELSIKAAELVREVF